MKKQKYLGDAVYAEYDGWQITLRTNSHLDSECDQTIYLEDFVWSELIKFIEEIKE